MPAEYHKPEHMGIVKRKTRIVKTIGIDVLDRIRNGPRPARELEYKFSGGVRKYRNVSDIYGGN